MTIDSQPDFNLNTADEEALRDRYHLPPRLIKRILNLRPFSSAADLRQRLWGIDAETMARLEEALPREPQQIPTLSEPEAPSRPLPFSPSQTPSTGQRAARPSPRVRPPSPPRPPLQTFDRWTSLGLLVVILIGAYFRFTGLNWDLDTHQHPDERFITMTADAIEPVKSLSEYFDTENSLLNPMDHGSYTYGMLPLFITRYIGEWTHQAEYDKVVLLGRTLSGLFDMASILALFFVGCRYYNRRVGLLAAALAAAAVLPIQLSHYFAVDAFSTVFVVASFWFAAQAIPFLEPGVLIRKGYHLQFGLFGLMIGLAMACKINTAPLFGIIGVAGLAHLASVWRNPETRKYELGALIQGGIVAALLTAVTFRVAQPYAFDGPGFFGISLNERWLDVIKEVTNQVAGNSEWPPNHHWTNRSQTTYAISNLIQWGMGIPMGVAAWAAWAWAAWRTFKGKDWRRHLLPVVWVGAYFIWQNAQFWRYMRYFIPIYPILALLAAWALVELYDRCSASRAALRERIRDRATRFKLNRAVLPGLISLVTLVVVIFGTYGWAFAFTRIYQRPHTRVEASRWIYQNLAGPLNIEVQSSDGTHSYPAQLNSREVLAQGWTQTSPLRPTVDGALAGLSAGRIYLVGTDLRVRICRQPNGDDQLAQGRLQLMAGDVGGPQVIEFEEITLSPGEPTYLLYTFHHSGQVSLGDVVLKSGNPDDPGLPVDLGFEGTQSESQTGSLELDVQAEIRIDQLVINRFEQTFVATPTELQISVTGEDENSDPLAVATWTGDFSDPNPTGFSDLPIDPVELTGGQKYHLVFKILSGGPLKLKGETYALETSWDDSLPLGVDEYNAGSIYDPLNLEMYETDTLEKRERMIAILDQVNYLVIPSNRAYDSMPRLPQRYPLSTKYYQALFGCAGCQGDDLEAAGYKAQEGFISPLGFELVASFTSNPNLGPLEFNDQYADESFTVYDHPKVMIFRKTEEYSSENTRAILEPVDLSQVFYQSPKNFSRMPSAMKLPADRLAAQKAGGTWSAMFNPGDLVNTNQVLGVMAWYLLIFLMGWLAFPLLFTALGGLPDRGYPLARLVGLLLVAWLAWLFSSLKILPFTRAEVGLCLALVAAANGWLAWRRWADLKAFVKTRWRSLLGVEVLFLALFLAGLAVRLANPDLWNPWLGGEKPGEMAYFNSILRSVYFPPQHPWFAGNTLNYYYYGYVPAAVPTKLLGILPSIAFNLIIPTWFAMVGAGIYSVVTNLVSASRTPAPGEPIPAETAATPNKALRFRLRPWKWPVAALAGLAGVGMLLFLGNLYQVRQFYQYLPDIGRPQQQGQLTTFVDKAGAAVEGGWKILTGEAELPGGKGRWYFDPSRPILHDGPDTPIAEFPLFTFLYADMHPHLLSMPAIFAALAWMISVLLSGFPRRRDEGLALLFLGGVVFGFTRPAHTWDFPSLVGLAGAAILAANWRAEPRWSRALLVRTGWQFIGLAGLSLLFYQPFAEWFGTGYTEFTIWDGARTPLGDYLTVHGLFLFILVSLLWLESRAWLGGIWKGLRQRYPGRRVFWLFLGMLLLALLFFLVWKNDLQVFVLGVPLLTWMLAWMLRPNQPVHKLVTWGLASAGVGVTLLVEVLVLKGDVGRSNMVFRYYLQAWAFFSVAAAVALVDFLASLRGQASKGFRYTWLAVLGLLVLAAAAYPLTAIGLRIQDRWPNITDPPHSLDGMAYMLGSVDGSEKAIYDDEGRQLDLSLDYAGIRFLQEHADGTPVIVEGLASEYRWGSRYSVYTGLPAVMGWNWHVRQHNSLLDGAVFDTRVNAVNDFYNTTDLGTAIQFLERYNVGYVIVGQMERGRYSADGIGKFAYLVGLGELTEVFRAGGEEGLVIYQTTP